MIKDLRRPAIPTQFWTWLLISAVLFAAAFFGQRSSATLLGVLVVAIGVVALMQTPRLGVLAIIAVALLIPLDFGTGTEVSLNVVTLLVPAMLALGVLDMVRRRQIRVVSTRANLPLALFLLAGLFSLFFGVITWDPFVPRSSNFLLVQLAQWGIFALSAGAFWLTANLISDETWLRRMTWTFLLLAGTFGLISTFPGIGGIVSRFTTIAFNRAPFWVLLVALSGGQFLFNRKLSAVWRIFLAVVLLYSLYYGFVLQRESSSTWVGIGAALGMLVWLRFARLRWPLALMVLVLVISNVLFPTLWEFAGGDEAWVSTGGSRVALIDRVIDVSMRNPITGLGPAACRRYAAMTPLRYQGANWIVPAVNSHNNYVDLFSQVGVVGLALFLWFAAEIALLGRRLHQRFIHGFASGYVNGMLAVGAGALVLMVFADWMLPFVYNIGFPGFQASVLVWLFLGGLVALENMPQPVNSDQ